MGLGSKHPAPKYPPELSMCHLKNHLCLAVDLQVPAKQYAMLASAVSSMALKSMAAKEGFHFQETLTGFKWLGNVAEQLTGEGYEVLFAFEEAIGFMFYGTNKVSGSCSSIRCSLGRTVSCNILHLRSLKD